MTPTDPRASHGDDDTQFDVAGVGPDLPASQVGCDAHTLSAGGQPSSPPAIQEATPSRRAPVVDPLLIVHATTHSDLERVRIATKNRLAQLTRTKPDEDGIMRGFGLDDSQSASDTHAECAVVDPTTAPGHRPPDAHTPIAGGSELEEAS